MSSNLRRSAFALVLFFFVTAGNLLAWGTGVHAYIGDKLSKKAGWKNVNEIYGSMAPDIINFMFTSPNLQDMYVATHFEFEELWNAAKTQQERSLAKGFLMHNNLWAADYSAHTGSLTLADHSEGYVIQKAAILAEMIKQDPAYSSLGLPDLVTLEICHNMVENSVELLVAQLHPEIGAKMARAASERSGVFPSLLTEAYAEPFAQYFGDSKEAAASALTDAERMFRQIVIMQGNALQQSPLVALDLVADLNVELAVAFLAQYGFELPEGTPVKEIITGIISAGMILCEDDFQQEIEATVKAVEENMAANGYRFPQY